ncbi:hypothetical protein EON65_43520 [archaeon]|nr:MAG: hypothetical protein EON65_43520 [archaeon]
MLFPLTSEVCTYFLISKSWIGGVSQKGNVLSGAGVVLMIVACALSFSGSALIASCISHSLSAKSFWI